MNTSPVQYSSTLTEETLDLIAIALSQHGYIILENALPSKLVNNLLIAATEQAAQFKPAGVGRDDQHQLNNIIRTDSILWLTTSNPVESAYLIEMEALREAMNKRLFMGLFDYEASFAHYPSGAFYKKHLDAFKGQTNRVLTTVFYLNENWKKEQGGDLVIYDTKNDLSLQVKPEAGTLVVFLSDEFPHEVKPANKDRYSIAGWFRVNNSSLSRVDPAH
ncbi:2OG-Fe(II) oxygenase [Neptunomonas japonica]|uniref:2OG-Fe(II) oxygenase n=1 Tax=Neptunomonas japonica TaxID=417574 RepID=UPI00042122B2|nr:2OG-Fe(II) oxygenase [Neptunomonas japonica]